MKFDKLRLLGFKSFVEPTEFVIQDGLTGVVGPNGCGKSNLVEALRWVMGENSYKNMRASSMDDVIFSGSGSRPSRNTAEVGLFLNNDDRTAPAAFNDAEELQVSRRIERESGSVYRINGTDVRAKDVQLLFADVSTGARSPSMIGQGRIGELISAKPQARRALLEEAAGISGLHSRRHDAELRLRAAETNLERLDDVIGQLESQLDSLKRQARQANRYRNIAGDIRKAEATILHLKWSASSRATTEAESILTAATMRVGETSLVQTEAAKAQAIIASKLPDLRDKEVKAAAALQRILLERKQLDQEAERATKRQQELSGRIEQLTQDIAREEQLVAENSDIISHLEREENQLRSEANGREEREATGKSELLTAEHELAASEEILSNLTSELAAVRAQSEQANRNIRDGNERAERLREQTASVEADLAALNEQMGLQEDVVQKEKEVSQLETQLKKIQQQVTDLDAARESAGAAEQIKRQVTTDARSDLNAIETEAKTLSRILNAGGADLFPSVLDSVTAQSGFEIALGAALGDDLDVALDASAAAYWSLNGVPDKDPSLPAGIESLKSKIKAPPELSRRLSQIGLVSKEEGDRLCSELMPGQRLVTAEGDLWRWDGYRASAEAPTAAALRLEQKNRLMELDQAAKAALETLRKCEQQLEVAQNHARQTQEEQLEARQKVNAVLSQLELARRELSAAERSSSELVNRQSSLEEANVRLASSLKEALDVAKSAEAALIALPDVSSLEAKATVAQNETSQHRAKMAEARATFETMARESRMRQERLEAIGRERQAWNDRAIKADRQIQVLRNRLVETENQQAEVVDIPADIEAKSRSMVNLIDAAEADRKLAADQLAATESQLREADKVAADMLSALSDAKQESVRAEERLEAARERRKEVETRIREDLNCEPHLALEQTGQTDETKLAEVEAVETKLERLKSERERLGAVNLRADEEQQEILKQKDDLVSERDDLIEAIRRLRQGIQSLNKEGRERLLTAFDEVNNQFMKLFTHLFGGGTAELQLVESDDPLEAGLEILARPPGKKPQTMTLLSGGEQALTAMALIFAVFLTNPAPICVLDEVDAPLDDHNVERFCNLMDQMCEETDTKFVIITHNPITMARMDRLFGVTMAERGVSQLVSVDLQTAETFLEAS